MRKGFTLIELLIVITIMAILAGAAVPYVQDYVEDARIAKCREDLGELRNAIMRYEVERSKLFDPKAEGKELTDWQSLLVGPFLTQALTDPWGRPYYFSNAASIVFSAAEDGDKNTNIISVDCRPAMAPTRAWWYDIDRNGAMSKGDYIDIKFTRPVSDDFEPAKLDLCATSAQNVSATMAAAGCGTEEFTDTKIHPKGLNWVRLNVTADIPHEWLMAGSLVVANKDNQIHDTSKTAADTANALYSTKLEAENLFAQTPTTASAATQVPVTIKAAQ